MTHHRHSEDVPRETGREAAGSERLDPEPAEEDLTREGTPEHVHKGSGKQFAEDVADLAQTDPTGTPEGSGKQFARGQAVTAEPGVDPGIDPDVAARAEEEQRREGR